MISPEGCSSILWKSSEYASDAAEAMCITADDLKRLKLIDEIIAFHNLTVLNYNTTIFLPFNNSISIKLDKIIEKITPRIVKEKLFLRHSYILKK